MTEREDGRPTVVPEEVLDLLGERGRIQGWLEKLREFRADATPEVYEKVRSDYEGRLQELSARLAEHRSDLEASMESHRARVEELQATRDVAAATLEEAELRFRVGEYGDPEWERRRDEGKAEIEALDGELGEEREALASLEGVLGELVGGPAPSVQEADEASVQEVEEASVDEVPAPDDRGAPEEEVAAADRTAEVRGEGDDEVRNGKDAPETLEDVEEEVADYLDELEFLESLSLEDAERFDAVSLMLEEGEEEGDDGEGPEDGAPRSP